MALPPKRSSSADSLRTIARVAVASFIVACLFFGRELLVPFALASLLTFLLAPLATRLEHGIGRVGAVLFIVAMLLSATGAGGWILTRQALDLANQLPSYKENIRKKLRAIEMPSGGPFSKISETMEELKKDLPTAIQEGTLLQPDAAKKPAEKPVKVEIVRGIDQPLEVAQVILAPILGPLGTASLVLLLLIFMLLQREDLRNKLIRLIGEGRISSTTRAMDDASARVTRYLLMLLVVNVTYGIPVAIGLYFIGVPNAILWGSLAIGLRFIPYVGPWIAASFPIVLSLAASPDWMMPVLTIALFIVLELVSNNVMEPWLYGASTGVTPIALIMAALIWTWLWGPVGLVLATPITVCLVVMGRHIPGLAFLSIAMSDEEALTPAEECYHRLQSAGDHDELELVEHFLKSNPLSALFDAVLIPVIATAEADHRQELLEDQQLEGIERGLSELLEELEMKRDVVRPEAVPQDGAGLAIGCLPARAYRDELAAAMLAQLMRKRGCEARVASAKLSSGELVEWTREMAPDIVCISAVPPTRTINARYLCTRLRNRFPEIKILVGLWGDDSKNADEMKVIREAGADEVVTSVADAGEWLIKHAPVSSQPGEDA